MPDDAPVTVVAALEGRALRYAEVERPADSAPRLRRLGTCDFDLDPEAAVLGPDGVEGLDAVSAALREVFRESAPRTLALVARPSALVSFFSPLPEGLSAPARYAQLQEEAALLADVPAAQPVRIRAVPVRSEDMPSGRHRWHHVVHVPEAVHARVTLLARSLGAGTYDLLDSTQTAGAVVQALLERGREDDFGPPPRPFALAVGSYDDHAEFSLSRAGESGARPTWHFGLHAAGGAPADAAYFVVAMLERIGVAAEDVGRVFLYGQHAELSEHDALAAVFANPPEPLDPMPLFGRRPDGVPPAALAVFAPCLGAVVR